MAQAVVILSLIAAGALVVALVMLIRGRGRGFHRDTRVVFGTLLMLLLFRAVSNIFEWLDITKALDPIEDFVEVIGPMLWGGLIYTFVQEVAASKLRESERRYRTLVENIDLGISLIDADFNIVMSNAAHGRFFGRPAKQFLRSKCFVEFKKNKRPCLGCPGVRAMATRKPAMALDEAVRNDGSRFPIRIRAFPVEDDEGNVAGFIEVLEDITELKQAEADRRKFESQVQHAQKLESLGLLAGGIAHDFNNLLVAVLGNADLVLQDLPANSEVRPCVDEIKRAALRASDLTNQMLSYAGKGQFVVEVTDLNGLVREMGELLEVSISKKVALHYELDPAAPSIKCDVAQIRQIVMNLITNANEAIGEQAGTITVRTGVVAADQEYLADTYLNESLPEGEYAYLAVADTGEGMDEQVKRRLFEPFFTTKFSGRGLGMAAVLGIVRSHKGAIKVDSTRGVGTTIMVLLPSTVAGPVARPVVEAVSEEFTAGGTILVIDDEKPVRDIAQLMLERMGFDVLTAVNGRDGLTVFSQWPDEIDLVLLDMTMPVMDGEETFRELRKIRPDVCVVLTSGYSPTAATARLEGMTPAGFIQKPFEMKRMGEVLREALVRYRKSAER